LLAVVCIFLGSVVGGRSDAPRLFRAAAASLFATGGLCFFAGAAGLVLQKGKRSVRALSLAAPSDSSADPEPVSGLQEEEQR
jgi:hypothetical protein